MMPSMRLFLAALLVVACNNKDDRPAPPTAPPAAPATTAPAKASVDAAPRSPLEDVMANPPPGTTSAPTDQASMRRSGRQSITPRNLQVKGALGAATVKDILAHGADALSQCYERSPKAAEITGAATASYEVGTDGKTGKVAVKGLDPDVDSCLTGVIERLGHPQADAATQVTVELVARLPEGRP